jgi:hypothetical protein
MNWLLKLVWIVVAPLVTLVRAVIALIAGILGFVRQLKPIPPLSVVRPDDFLVLGFEFLNLGLTSPSRGIGKIVTRIDSSQPGCIIVTFPPQSTGEQAFYEISEALTPDSDPSPAEDAPFIPARGEFAAYSRVLFELPASFDSAPFTLQSLLNLCYKSTGLPFPEAHREADIPTFESRVGIEAPFGLIIRETTGTAWAHSGSPVWNAAKTRVELWHTRLGVLKTDGASEYVDEREANGRNVVAIDSIPFGVEIEPFTLALEEKPREEIVAASALEAIHVNRLMLSALGAWLDVNQRWNDVNGEAPPIEEWQHRMTLGRDHYVRAVEPGYLYPFGHRASLVTITERKFQSYSNEGKLGAFLRQHKYIIVRERERLFDLAQFPFVSVRIKNLATPNLAPPSQSCIQDLNIDPNLQVQPYSFGEDAFFPRVLLGDKITDFLFAFEASDRDGNPVEFHLPLLFVRVDTASKDAATIKLSYNESNEGTSRRNIVLGGQLVSYAKKTDVGDAALESQNILVRAELDLTQKPPFFPKLEAANVLAPAINSLTGNAAAWTIDYYSDPVGNPGGVFANVQTPLASVNIPAEKSGGLTAPNFAVSGLSNLLGPVGGHDVETVAHGGFDPTDFFTGFSPMILGGILLTDILTKVTDAGVSGAGPTIPRLTRNVTANAIETVLNWTPTVKSSNLADESKAVFLASNGGAACIFTLKTTITAPIGEGAANYKIKGTLENFTVQLLPSVTNLIQVPFKTLSFVAEQGKKTDVTADLDKVKFVGPLEFVNALALLIPPDGFKDPPSVDVTSAGVDVGFSLGLPAIAMGYFSLQNVSFSAGLHLPFIGDPASLRFAFCERHNPFLLTVSAIGGGGFFGIELNLKGVQRIEFALEFGGNIAFDIGVASGGVMIMAGIYYEKTGDVVKLTGYVRVAGAVEVLGLVCISVEFFLGLEYDVDSHRAWGVATLTIEIEVLFFSKDVSMTVRREFPKGGDPTFKDLVPDLETWQAYCDSFADYGFQA